MPCSICSESGHNARTCRYVDSALDASAGEVDDIQFIELVETVQLGSEFQNPDPDAAFDEYLEAEMLAVSNVNARIKELEAEIDEEKQECVICYESVSNGKVDIKCGHTYCVDCFVKHMRVSNTCAYCRTELCELPQSKRRMSADTRSELIDMAFNAGLYETLHGDFLRQMRSSICDQMSTLPNTRGARVVDEMCQRAVQSVDMTLAAWIIGLQSSNYITDWYER